MIYDNRRRSERAAGIPIAKGDVLNPTPSLRRGALALAVLLVGIAIPLRAQVIDDVEELDWDRPEAWGMKFFNSVSLFTGLGAPRERDPWFLHPALWGRLPVQTARVALPAAKHETAVLMR